MVLNGYGMQRSGEDLETVLIGSDVKYTLLIGWYDLRSNGVF